MKTHFIATMTITTVIAAGCKTDMGIAIADLTRTQVVVQADDGEDFWAIDDEAARGCGIHDREPHYLGTEKCVTVSCRDNYVYACEKPRS